MTIALKEPGTRNKVRGQLLVVISAIAFSTAGFFTRQAPVDLWAMVFWRNVFGAAALLLVLLVTSRSLPRERLAFGRREIAVVALAAFGTICYLAAFKFTSVANISIIYATAPVITAMAAWFWLREVIARRTLIASLLALLGVGLTVAHSLGAGTLGGDGLALAMTIALSLMAVAARGSTSPALQTAFASALVAALVVLPLGWLGGASFAIGWHDAAWLAGFGVVTMAIALPCYLSGAARIPAGQGMLISALEMPLAPLWVWLAFAETPATATMIGGFIVALAVISALKPAGGMASQQPVDRNSPVEAAI